MFDCVFIQCVVFEIVGDYEFSFSEGEFFDLLVTEGVVEVFGQVFPDYAGCAFGDGALHVVACGLRDFEAGDE